MDFQLVRWPGRPLELCIAALSDAGAGRGDVCWLSRAAIDQCTGRGVLSLILSVFFSRLTSRVRLRGRGWGGAFFASAIASTPLSLVCCKYIGGPNRCLLSCGAAWSGHLWRCRIVHPGTTASIKPDQALTYQLIKQSISSNKPVKE